MVAAGLLRHYHVRGHGCGEAAGKDHSDQQARIHEVGVRGADAYDAECYGGCHQITLDLDKEMDFPAGIIVQENSGGYGTAVYDEYDGDTEIGDHEFLFALLRRGNLDLRGDEDQTCEGNEEPLIYQKPFKGEKITPPDGVSVSRGYRDCCS